MESLLNFFSAVLIISGGVFVLFLWLAAFVLSVIEVSDRVREGKSTTLDEDDDDIPAIYR